MQPRGKQVTDPKLQAMRDHPGPAVGASTRPHVIVPKTCQGSPEATGCASKRRCAPTLNKIMNSPKKAWWRPESFLDRLSFTRWPYKPRLPLLVKTPSRGSAPKDPDDMAPGEIAEINSGVQMMRPSRRRWSSSLDGHFAGWGLHCCVHSSFFLRYSLSMGLATRRCYRAPSARHLSHEAQRLSGTARRRTSMRCC